MNLTQQHLPLLIEARRQIESDTGDFICWAIRDAGKKLGMQAAASDLQQQIHDDLRGRTLGTWVLDEMGEAATTTGGGFILVPYMECLFTDGNQWARLAWLDRMIWEIEHA